MKAAIAQKQNVKYICAGMNFKILRVFMSLLRSIFSLISQNDGFEIFHKKSGYFSGINLSIPHFAFIAEVVPV
jgi:hypothetical protein